MFDSFYRALLAEVLEHFQYCYAQFLSVLLEGNNRIVGLLENKYIQILEKLKLQVREALCKYNLLFGNHPHSTFYITFYNVPF
jgi:hypothetical protein